MTDEELESSVQAGFLLISGEFRERIRNVAILIEDEPSEEAIDEDEVRLREEKRDRGEAR